MIDGRIILIVLLVLLTLFFVAFVAILFVYINQLSALIDPANCPVVNSGYTVQPNMTGSVAQCGNVSCQFTATSLGDAIAQCNASIYCVQFSWDPSSQQLLYLNNPLSGLAGTNVYVKPGATST